MLCGLHGVAFPRHVAHRAAWRTRQRGFLPCRTAFTVAGGGLRHDRGVALGCHLHVGTRRRLWRRMDLYAAGVRLCAGLRGNRAGAAAALLQAEPHLDLYLPRPAVRCAEREDRCHILHHQPSARLGVAYVLGGVCSLRVCVPRVGRTLLGTGAGVYRYHPYVYLPRRYQDGGVDRHASDHLPAGGRSGHGGGCPQSAGHEPARVAPYFVRRGLHTDVRHRPVGSEVLVEAGCGRYVHHHHHDRSRSGYDAEEPYLPHSARRAKERDDLLAALHRGQYPLPLSRSGPAGLLLADRLPAAGRGERRGGG